MEREYVGGGSDYGKDREANYRACTVWFVFHHRSQWRFLSTGIQYQDTARAMRKA